MHTRASGVIVHHSACSTINGKGFDYMILEGGSVVAASQCTEPDYIHVCLQGDFNRPWSSMSASQKEQLFVAGGLISRLAQVFGFTASDVFPHRPQCPGERFPWGQLVISAQDLYH